MIETDFDRIALVSDDGWDHNSHYHPFLLRQVPARCHYALDIGCGTGAFTRLLAARCDRVLALDFAPRMIQVARERSRACANIEFQIADVMAYDLPAEQFDCIATIATLHHLPLDAILRRIRAALGDNGWFIGLDLYRAKRLADLLSSLPAMPLSLGLRLLKTGRLRPPRPVRQAWAEHGRHDSCLTLRQVRHTCRALLPGARVRKHLLWRYSVVWQPVSPA
jgi:SAM-dependent methyltransferase